MCENCNGCFGASFNDCEICDERSNNMDEYDYDVLDSLEGSCIDDGE